MLAIHPVQKFWDPLQHVGALIRIPFASSVDLADVAIAIIAAGRLTR